MAKVDGSDIAKRQNGGAGKITTLEDWVKANMDLFKNQIQSALPKNVGYSNMASIALNILRADTNLQKCTPISFICAVLQSVQLNLEPNTALGHCYIIPYWNSKIKRYEAQWQIGYKGILEMGYRTNEIIEIDAEKVFVGDRFDWQLGTEKYIKHKPEPNNWKYDEKTGMPLVAYYYAIYRTDRNVTKFVVWTRDQIEKHMTRFSPAAKKDAFSPWRTTFDLMAQKTALKDLMRYAPLSPSDRRVLEADETVKKEIAQDMLSVQGTYEFNPDDTKGMDDGDFEGDTNQDTEKTDQEKPEAEKEKDSAKKTGVGKKSGQSKGKDAGKEKAGSDGRGSADSKPDTEPGTAVPENMDTTAVTDKQIDRLFAMAKKAYPEMDSDTVKEKVKAKFKLNSLRELVKFQYDQVCDTLEKVAQMNENKEKEGQQVIEDFEKHLDQE